MRKRGICFKLKKKESEKKKKNRNKNHYETQRNNLP